MGFAGKVREGIAEVRSKIKEAPIKRYENKMRKIDASAQRYHNEATRLENRNRAAEQLREAKKNAEIAKIRNKNDKFDLKQTKRDMIREVKQRKFDQKIADRKIKYDNDVAKAKSKVTKQLQSAVIDVIDGKPVSQEMLKYAKGSPAYRAMLKIKQGLTIGKENRQLAAIRAEMMSTNPLKREVAIKKFATALDNMKLTKKEKLKDYSAARERKTRLGEAAIKYGSMLGSATAISKALGSMYGGDDDE